MTAGPLAGHGILITRPGPQAAELTRAVEASGGMPLHLPLLEIVPRDSQTLAAEAGNMPPADLVIYISPNAARYGSDWHPAGAAAAAVGPATKAELAFRGIADVICPDNGFDSEGLLAHRQLADVQGKNIRIIRGQDGRELLGDTLRKRGARVDYLATYLRLPRRVPESEIRQFENQLRHGDISCVTLMSVASLDSLLALLPVARRGLLQHTRLVTPSNRVLKNITEQLPGVSVTLAPGPQADDMILGLAASLRQDKTE